MSFSLPITNYFVSLQWSVFSDGSVCRVRRLSWSRVLSGSWKRSKRSNSRSSRPYRRDWWRSTTLRSSDSGNNRTVTWCSSAPSTRNRWDEEVTGCNDWDYHWHALKRLWFKRYTQRTALCEGSARIKKAWKVVACVCSLKSIPKYTSVLTWTSLN